MTNQDTIVRVLNALLQPTATTEQTTENIGNPMVGKFCVVRCCDAGVHAGVVEAIDGCNVLLADARRLWSWRVPMNAPSFLSGVATHGLDHEYSKVGTAVRILLTEVCEVIPCQRNAEASIRTAPEVARTS